MELIVSLAILWGLYKFASILFSSPKQQPVKKRTTPKKSTDSTTARTSLPTKKASAYSSKSSAPTPAGAKVSPAKKASSAGGNRTYSGPLFAQLGEKGKLFGFADKSGLHELVGPFAIIDLETSGFNPPESKILEIAILKIDSDGNELDRFETLINPKDGKVGRTDIHGIELRMLNGAPTFSEASGRILEIIQNSIIVAHNARFEENFLANELNEVGLELDLIPAIDTLWLARNTIQLQNYKLDTVVTGFNERLIDAHTALGDVIAVSKILPEMLNRIGQLYYPISYPKLPGNSLPFKAKTR
jgi:DNA polymerase III epsilon subunit-like protein